MNRDSKELARRIDAMSAFQNGEDMQYCKLDGYGWMDLGKKGTLSFNWRIYDYRAKSKPREFWIDLTDRKFIEAGKGSKYWGEEHDLIQVREVTKCSSGESE